MRALAFLACMALTGADIPRTDVSREPDYGVACLALAAFSEDREHGDAGMAAVIATVLNRTRDPRWPDTVCGVVEQPGQFLGVSTWRYPRQPERIDAASWARAQRIAAALLAGDWSAVPIECRDATSFDQGADTPGLVPACQVGRHQFYTE